MIGSEHRHVVACRFADLELRTMTTPAEIRGAGG
jgi:hypothetical protein